jgi:phosphoglycolate phosphatase
VYDGVEQLLSELRAQGICIAVATAKQEHFAERILEEFKLAQFFETICGTDHDGERTTKAQVVAEVLQRLGIEDRDSVRMVGDRHHDAHGASVHGVSTIGVLWGYGDRDELIGAGVLHLVDHPSEITALVSG